MKKKKVNPNKRVVTQADLKKIKNEVTAEMTGNIWTIFFTVLRDKRGFSDEDLRETWADCEYLSDSIIKGYVTISDLKHTLKKEAEAELR